MYCIFGVTWTVKSVQLYNKFFILLAFVKVSRKRNLEANRADFEEFAINIRLNPHPNVLRIAAMCPRFKYPDYRFISDERIGQTAIVSPLQENGDLRNFFDSKHRTFRSKRFTVNVFIVINIKRAHTHGLVAAHVRLFRVNQYPTKIWTNTVRLVSKYETFFSIEYELPSKNSVQQHGCM